jgi:hypothetical protein
MGFSSQYSVLFEALSPTVPTILENSADVVGSFLLIVNFLAPKLHQKPSKLDKKKLKILSES